MRKTLLNILAVLFVIGVVTAGVYLAVEQWGGSAVQSASFEGGGERLQAGLSDAPDGDFGGGQMRGEHHGDREGSLSQGLGGLLKVGLMIGGITLAVEVFRRAVGALSRRLRRAPA